MKKYISIIFLFGFLMSFQNSFAQTKVDPSTIAGIVNAEDFSFRAERATPTNYDVINVMNALPNTTSTRILDIAGGNYSIDLKKGQLEVYLPYFGRVFNPTYGNTDKAGYRFTSKDFVVSKTQGKKGKWIVKIKINDQSNADEIIIEIFKNGRAFTSIRSNDRQPISYDGFISKNIDEKEKI